MTPTTNRESDKFMLRLPEGMRERIAHEADKAGRSMNAEIVARLSFTLDGNLSDKTELSDAVDRYQVYIQDLTMQISNIITEKNSYKFSLQQFIFANKQNITYIRAICAMINEDQNCSKQLKAFAKKITDEFTLSDSDEDQIDSDSINDTTEEMNSIIRDVKLNSKERVKNNPYIKAFGNNGFHTTTDISQRDPMKISDEPITNNGKQPSKKPTER